MINVTTFNIAFSEDVCALYKWFNLSNTEFFLQLVILLDSFFYFIKFVTTIIICVTTIHIKAVDTV